MVPTPYAGHLQPLSSAYLRLHGWQELDRRELPRRGQRFNRSELNLVDPPCRVPRTAEFSIITTNFESFAHHP